MVAEPGRGAIPGFSGSRRAAGRRLSDQTMSMLPLLAVSASGPRATWPAGKDFWYTSKWRVLLPSASVTWVAVDPARVHERPLADPAVDSDVVSSFPAEGERHRRIPVNVLEALAARIHCTAGSAVGGLATVNLRSP